MSISRTKRFKAHIARLLLAWALAASTTAAWAEEVSQVDAGTYEWLNAKGESSGVFFRLAMERDGTWSAEGKLPGKGWQTVSCGEACTYRRSTLAEVNSYFPEDWKAAANLACIQNQAQAFCRAVGKSNPADERHVIFTLATGRRIPIMLTRVSD